MTLTKKKLWKDSPHLNDPFFGCTFYKGTRRVFWLGLAESNLLGVKSSVVTCKLDFELLALVSQARRSQV